MVRPSQCSLDTAPKQEEIIFGFYSEKEEMEAALRWYNLNGEPALRIEAFADSFPMLRECKDFVTALLWTNNPPPEQVVELLKRYGFEDTTAEKKG